jgi:hypothetical protein
MCCQHDSSRYERKHTNAAIAHQHRNTTNSTLTCCIQDCNRHVYEEETYQCYCSWCFCTWCYRRCVFLFVFCFLWEESFITWWVVSSVSFTTRVFGAFSRLRGRFDWEKTHAMSFLCLLSFFGDLQARVCTWHSFCLIASGYWGADQWHELKGRSVLSIFLAYFVLMSSVRRQLLYIFIALCQQQGAEWSKSYALFRSITGSTLLSPAIGAFLESITKKVLWSSHFRWYWPGE